MMSSQWQGAGSEGGPISKVLSCVNTRTCR